MKNCQLYLICPCPTAAPSRSCWASQKPELCLQEFFFESEGPDSPVKVEVQNFLLTVNHADSTIVVQTFVLLCFSQNHLYWIPRVGGQLATSLYRMGQCGNWEWITQGIVYFFPQTEETIIVLFIKHLPDDLCKYIFAYGCAVSTLLPVFVQCVIK